MDSTELQPAKTPGGHRWLDVVLLTLLIASCLFVCWAALPIQPMHARRDALLQQLKAVAREVNDYRQKNDSLPRSLEAISSARYCPYSEKGYELIGGPGHRDFLIVANHVSIAENGRRFRYACNQELQIQEVSPTADEGQNPASPDQLR
jgi:hypothetical protein